MYKASEIAVKICLLYKQKVLSRGPQDHTECYAENKEQVADDK